MQDYQTQLAGLQDTFEQLAVRLREAADSIERSGSMPPEALTRQLDEARQAFLAFRRELTEEARSRHLSTSAHDDDTGFLNELTDFARGIVEFDRQKEGRLATALAALDEVLLLRHMQGECPALGKCQEEARVLKQRLADANPSSSDVLEDLASGRHSFCRLVEFVRTAESLDDKRWSALQEEIVSGFGAELATAAARGRITLSDRPEIAVPPTEPAGALTDDATPLDSSLGHPSPPVEGVSPVSEGNRGLNLSSADPEVGLPDHQSAAGVAPQAEDVPDAKPDGGRPIAPAQPGSLPPKAAAPPQPADSQVTQQSKATEAADERALRDSVGKSSRPSPVRPEERAPGTRGGLPDKPAVSEPAGEEVPPFSGQSSTREVAADIQSRGWTRRSAALSGLAWSLVRDERAGLAYRVMECARRLDPEAAEGLPSQALKVLALSPLVRSSIGEAVNEIRPAMQCLRDYAASLANMRPQQRKPIQMLLTAVAFRPTLLAPNSEASSLLGALQLDASSALEALREATLNYSWLGDILELNPNILKGVREHPAWADELAVVQQECRDWLSRNRQAQIIYAPTTNMWRRWLTDDGLIGSVLLHVIEDRREQEDRIRSGIRELTSTEGVYPQITKTDRELRGRVADLRPIEARAKKAVFARVQEALNLAKHWLDLLDREPQSPGDSRYQQADACRTEVLRHLEGVRAETRQFVTDDGSVAVAGAAQAVLTALKDLERLFDPATVDAGESPPPHQALNAELLLLPGVPLDDRWEPRDLDAGQLVDRILKLVEADGPNWTATFDAHSERRDHVATQRILEVLENRVPATTDLDELRERRRREIQECRAGLRASIDETNAEIERAVTEDLFAESQLVNYRGKVEAIVADQTLDFQAADAVLRDVREEIARRRADRVLEARRRLIRSRIGETDPEAYQRIEAALEQGNLPAANEFIAMVESGEPIPDPEPKRDAFLEFFPAFGQKVASFFEGSRAEAESGRARPDARMLIDGIRDRRSFGLLDLQAIPDRSQLFDASRMLQAWFQATNRQGDVGDSVRQVLTGLGFQVANCQRSPGPLQQRAASFEVTASSLTDRQICPVPQYGSLADGHYRVLCLWERPSEEEVVDMASRAGHDRRLIVFYFGRMREQRRRELARLCRERRRTFLMVDEALVIYLCGERGLRLPALFQCSLPFTLVDPYTTTAGLVPVEMFFGRARERESIIDRLGTNLVYGGRQLGKTALLRDVERRYHDPARGSIVKYVDLKSEGIGINRPIVDLWSLIAGVLHGERVLASAAVAPDALTLRIREWLGEDSARRIVLLLDEADAFLESDSRKDDRTREGYTHLWRLKGIMDETDRRFKVVFSGLHNVQRTSRDANTPLAHMGAPVCIGPLLEEGQWRRAHDLVVSPLWALGYRFGSDDMPFRILAHTNYYPSLIQLFCKHLLEHLSSKAFYDFRESPPYVITAEHVEDAYHSAELQRAIVDRFRWTLDLDPRYRLIALCIALESVEMRNEGALVDGFEAHEIRGRALGWWREGFVDDSSLEAFRTILDEMIGLGVLRKVGNSRYALRSPNVLNLLGTHDEIVEAIIDASEKEPPIEYEAASFRRALPEDVWRRSPLTAQQESEILSPTNGIAVLFGPTVAGADDILRFLRAASHQAEVRVLDPVPDMERFRREFQAVVQGVREGVTVIAVQQSSPWAARWALEADRILRKRRSKGAFVRALFLGTPADAWSWVNVDRATRQQLASNGTTEHVLKPWTRGALRRWMVDAGFGPGSGPGCERFVEVTGNWGDLLHELGRRCQSSPHRWPDHLTDFA